MFKNDYYCKHYTLNKTCNKYADPYIGYCNNHDPYKLKLKYIFLN